MDVIFRLVSTEEINDHKHMYHQESLRELLKATGFTDVRSGLFECGMNQWITARKPS
jgi:hypothetical protein